MKGTLFHILNHYYISCKILHFQKLQFVFFFFLLKGQSNMDQCVGCNRIWPKTWTYSLSQSQDRLLTFTTAFLCLHSDPLVSLEWWISSLLLLNSSFENGKWKCVTCKHDLLFKACLKLCLYKLMQAIWCFDGLWAVNIKLPTETKHRSASQRKLPPSS